MELIWEHPGGGCRTCSTGVAVSDALPWCGDCMRASVPPGTGEELRQWMAERTVRQAERYLKRHA
ncbi:hypothetical protein GCM10023226_41190 [Nocardioides nanhaiensis]|uniref:Cysteine-rich CPCC domain-containing protein n=1 Tax=Nocardioides nanhaiensis TaxID=1476871 RepID=A0ABP8X1W6_9ACTN